MPSDPSHIHTFFPPDLKTRFQRTINTELARFPPRFWIVVEKTRRKFYGGSLVDLEAIIESGIVSSNTFLRRWQLHRYGSYEFYFFFSLEESSRKETNDFKRERTNNREELGQKKGLETGFRWIKLKGKLFKSGESIH